MNITELEAKVIAQIARAEHSPINGSIPESIEDTGTWSDCVDQCSVPFTPITGHQLAGVISSLSQKNLISVGDECTDLTQAGFSAFMSGEYSK